MSTMTLTSPEEFKAVASAVADTTIFNNGLMHRLLQCPEDANQTRNELLGRAMELEEDAKAFMARSGVDRVSQLENELVEVCEQGKVAVAELSAASAGVMSARVGDANRENAYNQAQHKLKIAKDAMLPLFYTPTDEATKKDAVAAAQLELDAALLDMQLHPLAIPTAIRHEQEAKQKVTALAAKEAVLRREIAALSGNAAQPTGNRPSSTGLHV